MKHWLVACVLLISGCAPKYIPVQTITKTDTTTVIREKLVPINVPGSSVTVNLDSLVKSWKLESGSGFTLADYPAIAPQTVYLTDPKLQTRLKIFIDSLGNLVARCETLEREHLARVKEKDQVINSYQKEVVQLKESFGKRLEKTILTIIGGLCVLLFLVVVTLIVIKRMSS